MRMARWLGAAFAVTLILVLGLVLAVGSVGAAAGVLVTKTSDTGGSAAPGEVIHYTILITNTDPSARTVTVRDDLPPNVQYVAGSATLKSPLTYGDDFESDSYSGNTGTTSWSGPWVETNDIRDWWGGDIVIEPDGGSNRLRLRAAEKAVQRPANTATMYRPTLQFVRKLWSLETGDWFYLDIYDGSTWHQGVRGWTIGSTQDVYLPEQIDVTAYKSANFAIRFRTGSAVGTGDVMFVDNVEIYDAGVALSAPPVLRTNLVLEPGTTKMITLSGLVLQPLGGSPEMTNTVRLTGDVTVQASVMDLLEAPILNITKSRTPATVEAGENITYTVRVTNTGTVAATNVSIYDPVPQHTTYVGGSVHMAGMVEEPAPAFGPLTGLWGAEHADRVRAMLFPDVELAGVGAPPWILTGQTLNPGQAAAVTFSVRSQAPLTSGISILNTASVTCTQIVTPSVASASSTVHSTPVLTISKRSQNLNTPPLNPGDVIRYTITITNSGNGNATGTVVEDALPANTTFVPGSVVISPAAVGGTTGTPPNIATGVSVPGMGGVVTVRWDARVNTPLNNGTTISNVARTRCTEDATWRVAPTVTDTVVSAPYISVTKSATDMTGGAPLRPGDVLSYTVVLNNVGTMNYTNLAQNEFEDSLSLTHAAFVPGSLTASSGVLSIYGSVVFWNGDLLVGQPVTLTFAIQLNTPLDNGTTISNFGTAYYDSDGDGDFDGLDIPTQSNTVVSTVVASPNIVIAKQSQDVDGGAPLRPGDRLQYTLTFTNTGDMNATGMVLTDTIPAHTTFSWAGSPPGGGTLDSTSPQIRITGINLNAGSSATFQFNALLNSVIPVGTNITNRAYIAYDSDGNGSKDALAQSNQTSDAVTSSPQFTISKQVSPTPATPGQEVTYTVVVTNTGDAPATGVVVSDTLPSEVSFVPGSVTIAPPSVGGSAGMPPMIATGISAPVGQPITVTFRAAVDRPLDNGLHVPNIASVWCAENPARVQSAPAVFVVSSAPQVVGVKTMQDLNGPPLRPGDTVRYTLVVTNVGTMNQGDYAGIEIRDDLPADVTFKAGTLTFSSGTATYNGGLHRVEWNGALDVDTPVTIAFNVQLLPVLPNGAVIQNRGELYWDDNGDETNNATTHTPYVQGTVVSAPQIVAHKYSLDLNGGVFEPGDVISYTVVITNVGNMDQPDIPGHNEFYDPVFPGLTYHLGSATQPYGFWSIIPGGTTIEWTGPITVGQPLTLTWAMDVGVINHQTVVTDQAQVRYDSDADGDWDLDDVIAYTNTTEDTIYYLSSLSATKTSLDVNGAPLEPGDVLCYTVTINNTGNRPVSGAVFTDVVPANTTFLNVPVLPPGAVDQSTASEVKVSNISVPANGGSATIEFRVRINLPLVNGTVISNQGYVRYDRDGLGNYQMIATDDPATPAIGDPTEDTVTAAPFLVVGKTAQDMNGGSLRPGDVLSYTIRITNTGTQNATGVSVEDAVPAHTTFVPGSVTRLPLSAGGSLGSPPNLVSGMTVVAQTSVTVTMAVTVDKPLPNGTVITNTATVDADLLSPVAATITNTVTSAPLGAVSKAGTDANGGNVVPGDRLNYQFVLGNNGDMNQGNNPGDEVWDVLSPHVTFVSGSLVATSGAATYNLAQHRIEWNGGVAVGQLVTVTYSTDVNLPLPNGTSIQNTVYFTYDSDGNGTNDTNATATKTFTVVSAPLVEAVKSSQDMNGFPLRPSDVLSYTVVLNNVGNMDYFDLTPPDEFVDALPLTNASYVAASATASSGSIGEAGGTVTWNGDLLVGQPVTLTFAIQLDTPLANGTQIVNTGTVNYDMNGNGSWSGGETMSTNTITDTVTSAVAIAVTKQSQDVDGGPPLVPGDRIQYTIHLTNTGDMDGTGMVLTDTIPAHTSFSWAGPPPAGATLDTTSPEIRISGIDLASGASATFQFNVLLDSIIPVGTNITNRAYVSYDSNGDASRDALASSNQTSDPVTSAPTLGITKTVDDLNGAPVIPGDTLRYTVVVTNTGNAPAESMVISDTLSVNATWADNVTIAPPSAGGTPGSPPHIVTGLTVPVGSSVTVTYDVTVNRPTADGDHVRNVASVTALGAPTPVLSNQVQRIVASPTLEVSKGSAPALVHPGDLMTYTIGVTNTGSVAARDLTVSDFLPPYVDYVPGSAVLGVGVTYADDFETGDYAGNTGNTNWANDWSEFGDDGSPTTGNIQVVTPGGARLRLSGSGTFYVWREADTSDFVAPRLVFDRRLASLEAGDAFHLRVWNGSSWITVFTWSGPLDEATYSQQTVDLTPYKAATMAVGFQSSAANSADDFLDVDNVMIYDVGTPISAPPNMVTVPSLGVSESIWARLNVTAKSPLTDGMSIENVGGASCYEVPTPVTATASSMVESVVSLSATKLSEDVNGGDLTPGDILRYKIVLQATGDGVAANTSISDPLPAHTTWQNNVTVTPPSAGGTPGSPPNVISGVSVAAGSTVTVTFDVQIGAPLAEGTAIANTAVITSPNIAALVMAGRADTVHTPILGISKTSDPSPIVAGQVVTYLITVENTGTAAATDVAVVDLLPAEVIPIPGSTFIGSHVTYGDDFQSASYSGNTGTDPWATDWIETPADGGPVSGDISILTESASLRLRVSGTSKAIYRQADIAGMVNPKLEFDWKLVSLEAGDSFRLSAYNGSSWTDVRTWNGPADQLLYTHEVIDLAAYEATNFRIEFGSGGSNSADDYLYLDNILIYDAGMVGGDPPALASGLSIAPGGQLLISLQGNVASPLANGTIIINHAEANCQQLPTPVTFDLMSPVLSVPDVQVTKSSFDPSGYPLHPDEVLNYQIVLENVGSMDQGNNAGHELVDAIPADASYVPASLFFTSGTGSYNAGLQRIEWDGAVNVGQPVTVSFSVRTDPLLANGTPIVNTALLSTDTDGNGTNDTIRTSAVTDSITSAPFAVGHKTALDVNGSPLRPGDIISYTVVFTNVGSMDQIDKAGSEFLDDVPAHSSYVSGSAWASIGSVSYSTTYDRVAWSGDLPVGLPVTVKFAVQVDTPVANGTLIENTGRIFYDADGDGTTNEAVALAGPVSLPVVSSARVTIEKAAVDVNGAPLEPGDTLRYDLTMHNTGDMNAEGMVFTDQIPTHTSYVSVEDLPPGAVVDTTSPELRITDLNVAADSSVTFRLFVLLDLPLVNGTTISNQGLLEYDEDGDHINESMVPTDDPSTPALNDPTVRTVTSAPVLNLTKTSTDLNGAPLGPDDLLEYQIVVRNDGKANATGVVISDTLPAYTTWQDAVAISPPAAGGTPGSPPLVVTGMAVEAQKSVTVTYRVQIAADVPDGTAIVNTVAAQCTQVPVWSFAERTDTAYAPVLDVTKVGTPDPVNAGDILTYTISVANTGGYPTSNLSIADTLPGQVSYMPGSTILAVTATYADDFESDSYSGSTGTHPWASDWAETDGDGGPLAGDVNIMFESGSSRLHITGMTNYAWRIADLRPFLKPTLTFERKLVSLDGAADWFRVEIWNGIAWTPLETWHGPANDASYVTEAYDLSPYITADARIRFRSGTSNSADDHLYVDNVLIYDAGVPGGAPPVLGTGLALAPYTTLTATFEVEVDSPLPDGTVLTNTASVTSQHFPTPIVAVATNNVQSLPILSVDKSSLDVNGGVLAPNDVLRYSVVIENSGNADATQVDLLDEVPEYTTWIGNVSISPVSAGGVPGSPPNVATGMTVRGGESATVTYEVRIDRPVPDGTSVVNTASVSSLQVPGPFTDTVTDTVHSPTLLITKTGEPQPVEAGGLVTYTIDVKNTGSLAATGIVLTDTLPPEITYQAGTAMWKYASTYADTFSIYSYSENDGTANWSNNWTEQNDDGLPASGDVSLVFDDGSLRLNIRNASRTLWRQADVSYFQSPKLKFDRKITGLEAGKAFYLDVYNGSTWQAARTWFGPLNEGGYGQIVVDLTPYKSANLRIRFRAGSTLDASDNLYVDNVEIYDIEQSAGSPPNLVTGPMLPPGASLMARFVGRVDNPLPNGTVLPNTAWVRAIEWPVGVSSTFETLVHSTTAVQVTKSSQDVNGGDLQPGDVLRYQVVLENVGNQNQADNSGNELVDAIPAHTTYVPGSATATSGSVVYDGGGNRIEWNGAVNVGAPVTIRFDVQVDNGLPNGTEIVNFASAYYDANGDGSNEASVDSNTTLDTVASRVSIVATKVSEDLTGGLLEPGDEILYTIGITNTGSMDQPGMVGHEFEDAIPAHTTYVGGSASASSGSIVEAGGVILWDGEMPAGGSVSIEFRVRVDDGTPNNTLISNQGFVFYDSDADGDVDGDDTPKPTDDPRLPGPADPTENRVGYAPLLEATKISVDQNGDFLEPGDTLGYTVILRNIGNAPLVNNVDAEFLDDIPADTTYVVGSANATMGSVSLNGTNTQLRWDGHLDPGQAAAITFQVVLDSPLAHMTAICNQGAVHYDGDGDGTNESIKLTDDPRTMAHDDPTCDIVVSGPILSVEKSSLDLDGGQLLPKDLLRYIVSIENTGNDAARNVTIADTLPPEVAWLNNVVITPPSAGGTPGSPPNVVTGLEVPAGETVTVTFLTRVNSPLPNGTVITNTVSVTSDQITEPVTDSVTDVVSSDHFLELTKTGAPKPAPAGGLLTYTLGYQVLGDEPAPSAVITDRVPVNTTFVSASGGVSPVGGVLTWNLGALPAPTTGEVTFTVRVNMPLPRGTAISNTAYFRDQDGRSASATDTTLVTSDHTLSLAKLDLVDPIQAGELLTYTLTFEVAGNEPATGVLVSDGIPAGTVFHSASGGDSIEAPAVGESGMVRWSIASANPGETGVVTLTVRVLPSVLNGMSIINWATVSDAQGKGASASASTLVENTDLSITKSVTPAIVKSGDVVTYTVGYANAGPASALNVRITDTLPSGLTFGGMVSAPPGVTGPAHSGDDLVWSVGTVPSGASGELIFTATVDPSGDTDRSLVNTAIIGTTTAERNYGNNSATATNRLVQQIQVQIGKQSSAGGTVQPGAEIQYTIRVTNTGDGVVSGLTIWDAVPANTTFVPGSIVLDPVSAGTPGFAPPTLASNVSIPIDGSVAVRFRVRVNTPLTDGTLIVNTGEARNGGLPAPLRATVTDTVRSSHTLSLLKIDTPDPVQAGGLLTYTLQYQVMGNAPATDVVLADSLPSHVTVQTINNGGVQSGNQITWSLGTLSPPATGTVRFVVRVDAPLADGTVLQNAAFMSDDEGQVANATASTTVRSAPSLAVSKVAPATVRAGEILTYTLRYTNSGNAVATSLVITDRIPAHTEWRSGGSSHTATEVRWNVASLAQGASGQVTFSVRVLPDTEVGTVILNNRYGIRAAGVATVMGPPIATSVAPPTGITLDYFTLTQVGRNVVLEWRTVSEFNNWGFNVYRNTVEDFDSATRLNAELIPGQGRGLMGGTTYTFTDTSAEAGQTYYYWLEDVDLDGNTQLRLLRSLTVTGASGKYRVKLPLIQR